MRGERGALGTSGAARSPGPSDRFFVCMVLLGSALTLFHPLLLGKVPGKHVVEQPPFQALAEGRQRHLLDIELVMLPFLCHARRELGSGHIPLWNPYSGCGAPFLANQQSAVLHPLTWIALLLPWRTSLVVLMAGRFLLAFGGTYLLGRGVGLGPPAAAAAAAGYGLSGPIATLLCYPVSGVAAHLPLGIHLARRDAAAPTARTWLALVACLASSVLAGHFEYLPLVWPAIMLAGVERSGWRHALRRRVAAAAAALLLSSPLLLPGVEYLAQAPSFAARSGAQKQLPIDRAMLLGSVAPRLAARNYRLGPHAAFGLYAGAVGILLAAPAAVSRGARRVSLLLAASIALFTGNPLSNALWRIPPLVLMTPERGLFPSMLLLSMLAGHGVALIGRWRHGRLLASVLTAALLAERASLLGTFTSWDRQEHLFPSLPVIEEIRSRCGPERIAARGQAFAPNMAMVYRIRDTRLYDALGVRDYESLLRREGNASFFGWRRIVPSTSTRASAARVLLQAQTPRVASASQLETTLAAPMLSSGTVLEQPFPAAVAELRGVAVHVARRDRAMVDDLRLAIARAGSPATPLWSTAIPARRIREHAWLVVDVRPPIAFARNERLVLRATSSSTSTTDGIVLSTAPHRDQPRLLVNGRPTDRTLSHEATFLALDVPNVVTVDGGLRIGIDDMAEPRARIEDGSVTFERDLPGHLTLRVHAARRAPLLLADVAFPGWRCRIDGRESGTGRQGAFFAIELPAGSHEVSLDYEPLSYRLGLFLGCTGAACVAAAATRSRGVRT